MKFDSFPYDLVKQKHVQLLRAAEQQRQRRTVVAIQPTKAVSPGRTGFLLLQRLILSLSFLTLAGGRL
jgi:hypothetical protein